MSSIKIERKLEYKDDGKTMKSYTPFFMAEMPNWGTFSINCDPFSNCQTSTMASFASFLQGINDTVTTDKARKALVESFVTAVQAKIGKRQLMVDIREEFNASCEKYFPEHIIKTPYVNSTGSKMTIYLLKLW
jgi:hypothetical protein